MTFLFFVAPSLAATLSVDPGDAGAYATIAEAVLAAEDGDTIEIAAGTYAECVDLEDRSLTLVGLDGSASTWVDPAGACAPVFSLEDAAVDLTGLAIANVGQRGIYTEDSELRLDDVSISGAGNASYYGHGGAIYVDGGTLEVKSSSFADNVGYYGGHIYGAGRAAIVVADSTFSGGWAYYGGAVFLDGLSSWESSNTAYTDNLGYYGAGASYLAGQGSLVSTDDTWTGNDATSYTYAFGGALHVTDFATAQLTGATLADNEGFYGGAIAVSDYSLLELSDSMVSGNTGRYYGGGVYVTGASAMRDQGSQILGNSAVYSGGGVYAISGSLVELADTEVSNNVSEGGSGGGVYLYSGTSAALSRVTLSGNTSLNGGGGIEAYSLGETLEITDSVVEDNVAQTYSGRGVDSQYGVRLVIRGTRFARNTAGQHGGALTNWYTSDLEISDSEFEDNGAGSNAGAVSYYPGYATENGISVATSRFVDNWASGHGGALSAYGAASVDVRESEFVGNVAGLADPSNYAYGGGALYLSSNAQIAVSKSRFCHNSAGSGGAAHVYYNTADRWTNNIFDENQALYGGGLYHYYSGEASVINNTFVGHSASVGGAMYMVYQTMEAINNAIAYTETGTGLYVYDAGYLAYSTITYEAWHENEEDDGGGVFYPYTSDGHVFDDPMFVAFSADGDCSNDDLHPTPGSGLVNTGDPAILDPDGTVSDIGAYGGPEADVYDGDGDGFLSTEDCDDFDASQFPGADELCNAEDDDCDGEVDEDAADAQTWYEDGDLDGYGLDASAVTGCEQPLGTTEVGGDCDDADDAVFPGAEEVADDGVDQDCNGEDLVTEPPADTGDGSNVDPIDGELTPLCGCSSAGAPAGWLAVLALPLIGWVRRRD